MKYNNRDDFDVLVNKPGGSKNSACNVTQGVKNIAPDSGNDDDGKDSDPVKKERGKEDITIKKPGQSSRSEKPDKSGEGTGEGEGNDEESGEGKGSGEGTGEGEGKAEHSDSGNGGVCGPGGVITPQKSAQFQKDLGVPIITPPTAEEMKEMIRKAKPSLNPHGSKNRGEGKGDYKAYLPETIEKILNPRLDWKKVLKDFIAKIIGNERESEMPSRRFVSSGDYFYTHRNKVTKLKKCVICIDTSGSVSDHQLLVFVTEIMNIGAIKKFKNFELVFFDGDIQFTEKLTARQMTTWKPQPTGRGGTSIIPPFKYVEQMCKKEQVDVVICMTDGYVDFYPTIPIFSKKFIWVIIDNLTFESKWGKKIVYIQTKDDQRN